MENTRMPQPSSSSGVKPNNPATQKDNEPSSKKTVKFRRSKSFTELPESNKAFPKKTECSEMKSTLKSASSQLELHRNVTHLKSSEDLRSIEKTKIPQLSWSRGLNTKNPITQKKNEPSPLKVIKFRRSKSCTDLTGSKGAQNKAFPKKVGCSGKGNALKPASSYLELTQNVTHLPSTFPQNQKVQSQSANSGKKTVPKYTVTQPRRVQMPACSSQEVNAPVKITKVTKPAPYDYKARFQLLREDYAKLKAVSTDSKEKLSVLEKEREEYKLIKDRYEALIVSHEKILADNKNYVKYHNILLEKNSKLENQCSGLTQRNADLESQYKSISEKHEIVENKLLHVTEHVNKLEDENSHLRKDLLSLQTLRRSLLSTIQDLKGNIRVFCRIRPRLPHENEPLCCINYHDETTIDIRKNKEQINSITGKAVEIKNEFTFDKIFGPHCSQTDVFEELDQLVQSAIDGYHVCIFAYGQTGSGKTFTMQGERSESQEGIVPRSVRHIFHYISKLERSGWEFNITANFLEIYNECIQDLLNKDRRFQHDIRQTESGATYVSNLHTETVHTFEQLLNLIDTANCNRAVAATNFNEHSSRSHAVSKITINGTCLENDTVCCGSLNFVDLAGSESARTSERIAETKAINKSLSELGNVILSLYNKESHVPYRNSKLTHLLQSCLGGNSKTLMIVNISPLEECYGESISSLRFATNVKEVKLTSKKNKSCGKPQNL